jgi:L-aminopeptidase/D-esterase-like protein
VITDVGGVLVGHYTDTEAVTGCTIVVLPSGTVGAYTLAGAAPGSRETDLLQPHTIETEVHAFVLSGGSAFGLSAADGVAAELERQGVGFSFGGAVVPLVPAAVIFDLGIGDPSVRPGPSEGREALLAATTEVAEGSVGAGTGATVGKWAGMNLATKGGLGTASAPVGQTGAVVGALVVCNCAGDVIGTDGEVIAGSRADAEPVWASLRGQSTVLACVVTNARLDKAAAQHVARMSAVGIARSVRPAHSFYDGDIVFCGATGEADCEPTLVGAVGAELVAEALRRGVQKAKGLGGIPGAAG